MRIMAFLFLILSMLIFRLHAIAIPCSNPSGIEGVEIVNTLNLFSYYVGTHNYTMLDLVFSSGCRSRLCNICWVRQGLISMQKDLEAALGGTTSPHSLSTYITNVQDDDTTEATANSYLHGATFGQGNLTGQYLITYGSCVNSTPEG